MAKKFNFIEITLVCVVMTAFLKVIWFSEMAPNDSKVNGFTWYGAMDYELQHGHYRSTIDLISAWGKFVFSLLTQWILMFSVSCLVVVLLSKASNSLKKIYLDNTESK